MATKKQRSTVSSKPKSASSEVLAVPAVPAAPVSSSKKFVDLLEKPKRSRKSAEVFAVPAAPSLKKFVDLLEQEKKRSKKSVVAAEKPSSVEVLRIECKSLLFHVSILTNFAV